MKNKLWHKYGTIFFLVYLLLHLSFTIWDMDDGYHAKIIQKCHEENLDICWSTPLVLLLLINFFAVSVFDLLNIDMFESKILFSLVAAVVSSFFYYGLGCLTGWIVGKVKKR